MLKIRAHSTTSTSTDATTIAAARQDLKAAADELISALGSLKVTDPRPAAPTYVRGALPNSDLADQ